MNTQRDAESTGDHERLYQRSMHVAARMAAGPILFLYLVGMIGVAWNFPNPFTWQDFGALVWFLIFPWFATILFHTRQVYGSARGLEYKSRGAWTTVPWSEVETPEYTWWTGSPVTRIGRVASLQVPGKTKPIWFFANDRILGDLRRLRDVGILEERTRTKDSVPL